jgi:hypothetical protein
MHLDAFSVVRSQRVLDHVSTIGWHGQRPVVAWIPVAELEASAGRPLSADDAVRHVQWNGELVERIAAVKYERGEYVPHEYLGHEGVRLTVTWDDIDQTGEPWREPPTVGAALTSPDGRFGPSR